MVTMSQKELLLHLSERQVQRLKRRYRPDSIDWVHHGNLGRSMPWAVSPPQKQLILTLARGKYVGFNDSHLREKLCAEEGLALSRETVRRILRAAKLASPQQRRPRQYRSRPHPRAGAPHPAGRKLALPAAAPPAPVPPPPPAPPAFRHDGAHRRQPSRLDRGPRPRAHPDRLSGRRHPQNSRRPLL